MSKKSTQAIRLLAIALSSVLLVISDMSMVGGHEQVGEPSTDFRINSVSVVTKGPYKPGDLIVFSVNTNLPKSRTHFIQASGECLAYPAEWHEDTEENFEDASFVKRIQLVAVISSGCIDGIHSLNEVLVFDKNNSFTSATINQTNLPRFQVNAGQLFFEGPRNELRPDSIVKLKIPSQIRLDKGVKELKIASLPRISDGGQTLDWSATGSCRIKKFKGQSDLGGQLYGLGKGSCVVSVNTPWGSNIYLPINQAKGIELFPSTALLCSAISTNQKAFYLGKSCPKGTRKVS